MNNTEDKKTALTKLVIVTQRIVDEAMSRPVKEVILVKKTCDRFQGYVTTDFSDGEYEVEQIHVADNQENTTVTYSPWRRKWVPSYFDTLCHIVIDEEYRTVPLDYKNKFTSVADGITELKRMEQERSKAINR